MLRGSIQAGNCRVCKRECANWIELRWTIDFHNRRTLGQERVAVRYRCETDRRKALHWGHCGRRNVEPKAGFDMQLPVRLTVGNLLEIMQSVQEDIILLRSPIWNITPDAGELKVFYGAIDFEKKCLVVVEIWPRDEIEAGADPASGQITKRAKFRVINMYWRASSLACY